MTTFNWVPIDSDAYSVMVRGQVYYLRLVDDGVLPAGWRLRREDATRYQHIAAAGRSLDFVFAQARFYLPKT